MNNNAIGKMLHRVGNQIHSIKELEKMRVVFWTSIRSNSIAVCEKEMSRRFAAGDICGGDTDGE